MSRFRTVLEEIEIVRKNPVQKHGTHDQKTHGNWATGSWADTSSLPEGVGYKDSDVVFHVEYDATSDIGPYVEDYTMNAYGPINTYLRTGKWEEGNESGIEKSEVSEYRRAMDYVIGRTETPRDFVLYRGTSGVDKFDTLKEGDVFTDNGYVSTTTKPDQVWAFMSTATGDRWDSRPVQKGYVLQINVPKGSNVLSVNRYFKGISELYGPSEGIREENEHILPRGTRFRVDSIGSVEVREGIKDKLIKVTVVNNG